MKFSRRLAVLCAALGLAWAAGPSTAAEAESTVPAGASPQVASSLNDDAKCTRCHDESEAVPVLSIYQTRHGVKADERTPTCQSCHGASEKHLAGDPNQKGRARPDVVYARKAYKPNASRELASTCLGCHSGGLRQHWTGSQHDSEGMACTNCHRIHAPSDAVLDRVTQPEVCFGCHKEQRSQMHKYSTHPVLAGKMGCSDCHNPHGSTGPKLLVKNSVNETCHTCHAEKRGPFLFEHQPVTDDCTNCHNPHGSNNSPLLKARLPWLCQECHSGDHARSIYSGANLPGGNITTVNGNKPFQNQAPNAQIVSRDCLNCHSLIHGSNSPAGAKFQR
jgi:DmsE family decaheme c-type cytochrome